MIPVCRLEDLPEGGSVRIDTAPPIAVFHADAVSCTPSTTPAPTRTPRSPRAGWRAAWSNARCTPPPSTCAPARPPASRPAAPAHPPRHRGRRRGLRPRHGAEGTAANAPRGQEHRRMRTVTIVGASLAGLYAARELRAQGFDGRLVDRRRRAAPRPTTARPSPRTSSPAGPDEDHLALADAEETAELDAEWLLGVRARGLDTRGAPCCWRTAAPSGHGRRGHRHRRHGPAPARCPPRSPHPAHPGRRPRPARPDSPTAPRRVVVIGGGFIGAETAASSCRPRPRGHRRRGRPAAARCPNWAPSGRRCAALHRRAGVGLVTGTGVASAAAHRGGHRRGADRRPRPARRRRDRGHRAAPNTAWLAGSTCSLGDGVLCDDGCVTGAAPGGRRRRCGPRRRHPRRALDLRHPTAPRRRDQPARRAHRSPPPRPVPYFWSDQYGSRIQFAGRYRAGDTVRVTEGELSDQGPGEAGFLARYERDGHTVGRARGGPARAPSPAPGANSRGAARRDTSAER